MSIEYIQFLIQFIISLETNNNVIYKKRCGLKYIDIGEDTTIGFRSTALTTFALVVSYIGAIYTFLLMIIFIYYRKFRFIRRTSIYFIEYILFELLIGFVGEILYNTSPTDIFCLIEIWASKLSIALIFGSMLAKNIRIYLIFIQNKHKKIIISNLYITIITLIVFLLFVILLSVYTFVGGQLKSTVKFDPITGDQENKCNLFVDAFGLVMIILLYSFTSILIISVYILSLLIRSVPSEYNESKNIKDTTFVVVLTELLYIYLFAADYLTNFARTYTFLFQLIYIHVVFIGPKVVLLCRNINQSHIISYDIDTDASSIESLTE